MKKHAMLLMGLALAACATEPTAPPQVEAPPAEVAAPAPVAPEAPQKPQQTDAGRFRIAVASLAAPEIAAPWVGKAEAAGYRTELLAVEIEGKTWHRVLLPGYESLDAARAALPFIAQDLGVSDAWVTSRRRAPAPAAAAVEQAAAEAPVAAVAVEPAEAPEASALAAEPAPQD